MLQQQRTDFFSVQSFNKILAFFRQIHQHSSKELSRTELLQSKQLSSFNFCILNKSSSFYNNKTSQFFLNTQEKRLSPPTRSCNVPSFIANKEIADLAQHKLAYEESSSLKNGFIFSNPTRQTFLSQKIWSKIIIFNLLTTLNPRRLKCTSNLVS